MSNQSAGPSRQRIILYAVIGGVVWVILMIGLVVLGLNRRTNFYATETAAVETSIALDIQGQTNTAAASATQDFQTNEASAATQSFFATQTNAPTATATIDLRQRTLPPPQTLAAATDAPTRTSQGVQTAATALPPPPDTLAESRLIGYGGTDFSGTGYLPMLLIPLDGSGDTRRLGDETIDNVQFDPLTGQNLVYTRYFPVTFNAGVEASNLSGTETQPLQDMWQGLDGFSFLEIGQVNFAQNGQRLVFRARVQGSGAYELFVLDFNRVGIPNEAPLIQLTEDELNYAYPSISADGSSVVAVATDPNALDPAPDLVLINVNSLQQNPLTDNGNSFIEGRSAFYPNENAVIFSAAEGVDAPADIFRLSLESGSQPLPLVRLAESDETHPVISPDGQYLAYASNRTGAYNVFVDALETQETFQVTNVTQDDIFPEDWFSPSAAPGNRSPALLPLPTPVIPEPTPENDGGAGT